jgi:antitoxin component YwqK of YwqJK toxin-antitoxin module
MELSVSYQNYMEWTGLDNTIHKAWTNAEGKYHKEDGPAHIIYHSDGLIFEEFFYMNGVHHRENGPSYISYFKNGLISTKEYHLRGFLHRMNGPAIIWYNRDSSIELEQFYKQGEPMGNDAYGFWNLFDNLTEDERKHPDILMYIARYS